LQALARIDLRAARSIDSFARFQLMARIARDASRQRQRQEYRASPRKTAYVFRNWLALCRVMRGKKNILFSCTMRLVAHKHAADYRTRNDRHAFCRDAFSSEFADLSREGK